MGDCQHVVSLFLQTAEGYYRMVSGTPTALQGEMERTQPNIISWVRDDNDIPQADGGTCTWCRDFANKHSKKGLAHNYQPVIGMLCSGLKLYQDQIGPLSQIAEFAIESPTQTSARMMYKWKKETIYYHMTESANHIAWMVDRRETKIKELGEMIRQGVDRYTLDWSLKEMCWLEHEISAELTAKHVWEAEYEKEITSTFIGTSTQRWDEVAVALGKDGNGQ